MSLFNSNYNQEDQAVFGIKPSEVYKLVSKFVDGQILMAVSYVIYKYSLSEANTDNTIANIKQDIHNGNMFADFLPPYYWGVIDSIFVKKGIHPSGNALAIITLVMFFIYGRERGEKITKELLAINDPKHHRVSWFNTLRIAGSLGFDAQLAFIASLEDKSSQNKNIFGENSFYEYLNKHHEHYILEMIKRSS